MSPSKFSSSLILLSCLFLLSSTISAHNITRILDRDPNFSIFNQLLTSTHLVEEINRRKTITVLAIPNDSIGDLTSKSVDAAKAILMSHIVLDYYDILKLQKMKGKSTILTTLYQTTGVASYQQGFLNATDDKSTGEIVFGSAVKGAPHDVRYLDTIATQPYNISVLSVSKPIVVPGIDGQPLRPVASPPKSNAPAPKLAPAPAPAPTPAEAPEADAPASDNAPAPSEADAPSDAPASSPSADAPGPASDDASDKPETPKSSSAKRSASSFLSIFVVLISLVLCH